MAAALQGCVIVEDQGSRIRYKKKCEKCGWVDGSTVNDYAPMKGSTRESSFYCPECKVTQKVRIQGT